MSSWLNWQIPIPYDIVIMLSILVCVIWNQLMAEAKEKKEESE